MWNVQWNESEPRSQAYPVLCSSVCWLWYTEV